MAALNAEWPMQLICTHVFCRLLVIFISMIAASESPANDPDTLEKSVCGSVREPFAFWLWSRAAGKPDPEIISRAPNAVPTEYRTRDGRLLKGYKLASTVAGGAVTGSVLVAQGNAMLADQLIADLNLFSHAGIEVYIFDYRGYGNSEGKPRLKAIVSDYRELVDHVGAITQGRRFLYGISFGGVVLLNVIGSGIEFDRMVIDSTPGHVSHLGCPQRYDPAANFPREASGVLMIAGERDTVVPLKDSQALIELAKARGGRAEVRAEYAHPFMDPDIRVHRDRLKLVLSFLAG